MSHKLLFQFIDVSNFFPPNPGELKMSVNEKPYEFPMILSLKTECLLQCMEKVILESIKIYLDLENKCTRPYITEKNQKLLIYVCKDFKANYTLVFKFYTTSFINSF